MRKDVLEGRRVIIHKERIFGRKHGSTQAECGTLTCH
jgi:hypothetical protein